MDRQDLREYSNLDLENFRYGLVFRKNDTVVLGEYNDVGEMGEGDIGVISDFNKVYENMPRNRFAVVEIIRPTEDRVILKDKFGYFIGEDKGIKDVVDIYEKDPEEFFDIISDIYEEIISEAAH